MKKLAELKKTLADLKAEGLAIVNAADDGEREFTAEEEARLDEIETESADLQRQIEAEEARLERRRTLEALPAGGTRAAGQITVDQPDPAQTGGFKDIGEFAVAVASAVNAGRMGGAVDERLLAVSNSHQGGGSAGEGYSLPPAFRDEVWELVSQFDQFGPLIDEEPTSARQVKLGADETTPWGTSGISAYWRTEGSQMTASRLADEGRSVPLHDLYTLATATEELLADAPRLRNRLTRKAAEAIAWMKNLAIVDGSGAGQPLGWMRAKSLVEAAKESGQVAKTITAQNVIAMYARLKMIPGDRPFWLIGQDCLPELMTMTIGDRPIWVPPTGLAEAPGGFLLGLPVRFSEFAETLGAKGDIQLVSPRGYYGVRRAAGVSFASSIHLYFDYNVEAFRWLFRYGGQPHLQKPVTPAKSAATQSHFITLAERA